MIPVAKHELLGLAKLGALANTPASLFGALATNSTVERLRSQMGVGVLIADLARFTARARRTEITVGLAYAVLVAILTHKERAPEFDPTRLTWGDDFVKLARAHGRAMSIVLIDATAHQLTHHIDTSGPSSLRLAPAHPAAPEGAGPN
jgi:hypothetical protein